MTYKPIGFCTVEGCDNPHIARGLCTKHWQQFKNKGILDAQPRAYKKEGYIHDGSYRMTSLGKLEHIAIAEKALGKPLPVGAIIHHVNGNGLDNHTPWNLVICPDQAYHGLLHQRSTALQACGNAGYRKCQFCWGWDDPIRGNMFVEQGRVCWHRRCVNRYRQAGNRISVFDEDRARLTQPT